MQNEVFRFHITKTLVIPPLVPGEPEPVIIRLAWWKKLIFWAWIASVLYFSLKERNVVISVLLLALPVRLHNIVVDFYQLNKK